MRGSHVKEGPIEVELTIGQCHSFSLTKHDKVRIGDKAFCSCHNGLPCLLV